MLSNTTKSKPRITVKQNKPLLVGEKNGEIQGGGLRHVEKKSKCSTSTSAHSKDRPLFDLVQDALDRINEKANQIDLSDEDSTDEDSWSKEYYSTLFSCTM